MVLFSLPRENLAAMWIAGCGIGRAHSTRPPCAAHFHLASISPYPALLHKYQMASQWGDAIRLARFVKDDKIWASLATMAAAARELDTAEMAYAAIDEVDKVEYIQHIKQIPTVEGRNAAMALFCKQPEEAESILLQAGLIFRAIELNCNQHNWEKALDLAVRKKTHIDTVVALRQRHLARFNKEETNTKFIQYGESMEVDWESIKAKIAAEEEAERSRPGARPYA
eukprot:m.42262 g.42262  ORF g.42262 m.42262 type:complete len:226 (+) comp6080_c0_seq4:2-679(+)